VKSGSSPRGAGRGAQGCKTQTRQTGGTGSPRDGSKLAKVIGILASEVGTTIEAIVKATRWWSNAFFRVYRLNRSSVCTSAIAMLGDLVSERTVAGRATPEEVYRFTATRTN